MNNEIIKNQSINSIEYKQHILFYRNYNEKDTMEIIIAAFSLE